MSDRENFQFSDAISEHTIIKMVDLNRTEPTKKITTKDLLTHVRGKNILVVVHGFNMTYSWSLDQFRSSYENFKDQYDLVIGYLWPGGNQWWEYRNARRLTLEELPYRLLTLMSQFKSLAKNVDFLAHSMGCRLTLETLDLATSPLIRNLFLTAPAVSNISLQLDQRYYNATCNTKHTFVFHSKYDEVSSYAFPIVEGEKSLGLYRPKHPDLLPYNVTSIDCSHCVDSHSGYDNIPFFRGYIKKIIASERK